MYTSPFGNVNIVYLPHHKKLRNNTDCYYNSPLITDMNYGIIGYDTLYFGGLLPKLNTVMKADHKM